MQLLSEEFGVASKSPLCLGEKGLTAMQNHIGPECPCSMAMSYMDTRLHFVNCCDVSL